MGREAVVIVGGGIGGLTTALALMHHDVPCVVYERAPELHELGAGVGLWPSALQVFDRLGVGAQVRALSGSWTDGGIRRQDGRALVHYTADAFRARLGDALAGVHRGELQQVLLRALPDGVVRTGHACTGAEGFGDRVTVSFGNGVKVEAPVLIGADGLRSVIRTNVFSDKPLNDCGVSSWRGTLRPGQLSADVFTGETWGDTGMFGFLPISDNRLTWFCADAADDARPDKEYVLERFGDWHAPIRDAVAATPDDQIWFDRIYDRRPLRRWTKGRVALVGDAAHPMTPALGQGACQAILDGWVLAEALGQHRADIPRAFATYNRRRRLRGSTVSLVAHLAISSARQRPRPVQLAMESSMRLMPAPVTLRGLDLLFRGPLR